MQRTMFIRPVSQPRSVSAQKLEFILVPGKRKPFKKQWLEPVPPKIDNRTWYTVAQVRKAIAQNRLAIPFRERALAEVRAYEMHYSGTSEIRVIRGGPTGYRKDTPGNLLSRKQFPSAWEDEPRLAGNDPLNGALRGYASAKPKTLAAGSPSTLAPKTFAKFAASKRTKRTAKL